MKIKLFVVTAVLLLFVVIVPVVLAQTRQGDTREWQDITLQEFNYEEVSFRNMDQDIQLAGMLFVPEGEGPFPAVVYMSGSGASFRENRWFLTLAKTLLDNGILVLLPDKRGSVKSEGDWHSASFQDLTIDTIAAVNYLLERDDLPISHIGLVGSSQGGHFSPVAAALSPDVSFVVNLSGTAVPIREQLVYEETHNLRQMGLLPGLSDLAAYPAAWSIREVRQKELWDAIGDFDPLPYWQDLEVEALVIYGEEDTNIPAVKSTALLRSLNKANITVKLYDGSGHDLETPEGEGNSRIRQEVLQDISSFILSTSS